MSWLANRTLMVTRYGAGEWVEGLFVRGDATAFEIHASAQPLRPNELLQLPEGRRTAESLKVYTDTLLRTSNESTLEEADQVVVDGITFEVHSVARWIAPENGRLSHYKAILVKKPQQGTP